MIILYVIIGIYITKLSKNYYHYNRERLAWTEENTIIQHSLVLYFA